MLSTCPSCQRQIQLPDEAVGKKVRCSGCQAVFVLEEEVPVSVVEEEVPVSIVPAPSPEPPDPFAIPPAITPVPETGESYTANLARKAARRASTWMIVAGALAVIRLVFDVVAVVVAPGELKLTVIVPGCIFLVMFVPLLILVCVGIHALRTCGSRAMMMVGAAGSFVMGLYGFYGLLPSYRLVTNLFEGDRFTQEVQMGAFGVLLFLWVFFLGLGIAGVGASVSAVGAVVKTMQANAYGPRISN